MNRQRSFRDMLDDKHSKVGGAAILRPECGDVEQDHWTKSRVEVKRKLQRNIVSAAGCVNNAER